MKIVRIYNLKTQTLTEIPAAELAPGFVQATVPDIEGIVFVDSKQIGEAPYRHPPFTGERLEKCHFISQMLHEVYPKTPKQWERGFRRDMHPDREQDIWFEIILIHYCLTRGRKMSLQQKRDYLAIILVYSTTAPEYVLSTVELRAISREEAAQVVEQLQAKKVFRGFMASKESNHVLKQLLTNPPTP